MNEYKVDPSVLARELEDYLKGQRKSVQKAAIINIIWALSMIAALILLAGKGGTK